MRIFFALIFATYLTLAGFGVSPASAAGPNDYIVQPGDTVFGISARYGVSVEEIAAANGLDYSLTLYAGQPLVIPTAYFVPPPAPQFINTPPMPQPAGDTYTVESGDTLYGIAARFGTTVAALQTANGLSDFGPAINIGQQLLIPAGDAPIEPLWNQPAQPAPPAWSQTAPAMPNPSPWNVYPVAYQRNPVVEKWIDVDLTTQSLVAYEGRQAVFKSRVSSGIWEHPTIVGTFQIYVKYESADMSGGAGDEAYFLPSVPYVMYFSGNFGLHGTYWHHNFGTPMSHGCVNLPTRAAEWLYNWAPVGTRVVTHY
ncbi:MAG: LysM peptidoglycan-binding domain-containing protein [Anaerolineae bacterium]